MRVLFSEMPRPPRRKYSRGDGVDLPGWFLQGVNARFDDLGQSMGEVGKLLADAIGREEKFDHSTVSRFLSGKNTTIEMAQAFAVLYRMPMPVFIADTREDAERLEAFVSTHLRVPTPANANTKTAERVRTLRNIVDEVSPERIGESEPDRTGHTPTVISSHERKSGSGRARRSHRRGPSS